MESVEIGITFKAYLVTNKVIIEKAKEVMDKFSAENYEFQPKYLDDRLIAYSRCAKK